LSLGSLFFSLSHGLELPSNMRACFLRAATAYLSLRQRAQRHESSLAGFGGMEKSRSVKPQINVSRNALVGAIGCVRAL